MEMGSRVQEKYSHPKSSWREKEKVIVETLQGTEQKKEKGKGEGLNSIKTVETGGVQSLKLHSSTLWCSGGKGESSGADCEVLGVLRPHRERRLPC